MKNNNDVDSLMSFADKTIRKYKEENFYEKNCDHLDIMLKNLWSKFWELKNESK